MITKLQTAISEAAGFAEKLGRLDLVYASDPGTSDARVFILHAPDVGRQFASKCTQSPRVPLDTQVIRRNHLTPYLADHLPEVLHTGLVGQHQVMVTECPSYLTLHSLIMNANWPEASLVEVWKSVVTELSHMWLDSRQAYNRELCPRNHEQRCDRVVGALQRLSLGGREFADWSTLPLIINGVEYPPLASILPSLYQVGQPEFGVTCHGDPQPSNVLVDDKSKWYLVDWEWCGSHHDWRMMVSHLYGWWPTRCSVLRSEPEVSFRDGHVILNYDIYLPERLYAYRNQVLEPFSQMTNPLRSSQDCTDVNRYLATLYLGDIRFLQNLRRPRYLLAFLGEGIRTLSHAQDWSEAPLSDDPFAFPWGLEPICIVK